MSSSSSMPDTFALTREITSAIQFLRTTEMQTFDRVQGLISQIHRGPAHQARTAGLSNEQQLRLELQEMTDRLGAPRETPVAAREDALASKIDQILRATREAPDLSEITAAVYAVRSHIDGVSQDLHGLGQSLSERLDRSVSISAERLTQSFDSLAARVSDTMTAMERESLRRDQDFIIRSEAKDTHVSAKLGQVLKSIRETASGADVNAAYGKLDAKLDAVAETAAQHAAALTTRLSGIAADLGRALDRSDETDRQDQARAERELIQASVDSFDATLKALKHELTTSHEHSARDIGRSLDRIEKALVERMAEVAATMSSAMQVTQVDAIGAAISELGRSLEVVKQGLADLQGQVAMRDQERHVETSGARELFDAQRTSQLQLMTTFRVILRQIADDAHAFHALVTERPPTKTDDDAQETLLQKLEAMQSSIEALAAGARSESAGALTIPAQDAGFARELETRTELDVAKTSLQQLIVGFRLVLKQLVEGAHQLRECTRDLSSDRAAPTQRDPVAALSDQLRSGLSDVQRMVASGNEVLADIHAMASSRMTDVTGSVGSARAPDMPSWTEAWHVFSTISTSIDGALGKVTRRLDEVSITGVGPEGASDLRSMIADAAADLSDKVEMFLSITAALTEDIGRAAPAALMAHHAPNARGQ